MMSLPYFPPACDDVLFPAKGEGVVTPLDSRTLQIRAR